MTFLPQLPKASSINLALRGPSINRLNKLLALKTRANEGLAKYAEGKGDSEGIRRSNYSGGGGVGGINEFSQVTHGSSSTSSGAVSILMKCARAILKHSCFFYIFSKKNTRMNYPNGINKQITMNNINERKSRYCGKF